MTQIGSSTPTYDGNGNVLSDTAHTYTWDVYGKPISIDSVTLTYDALGRMVEQNRNGSYTEIDYAPTGAKLQILQGQQAVTDFNALPGQYTSMVRMHPSVRATLKQEPQTYLSRA